eukprot:scaffold3402_cov169-Amphora_coffeaeformis.AAC.3
MWKIAAGRCLSSQGGRHHGRTSGAVVALERLCQLSSGAASISTPARNIHRSHLAAALFSTSTSDNLKQSSNNKPTQQQHNRTRPAQQQTKKQPSVAAVSSFARQLQKVLRQAEAVTTAIPWMTPETPELTTTNADNQRVQVFQQTSELWETMLTHVRQGSIHPQGKHRREASIFCETILRLYAQSNHDDETNHGVVWKACQEILDFMKIHELTIQEEHCQACLQVAVRYGFITEAAALFRQQIDPDQAGYRPYRSLSVNEPVGLYALAKDSQQRELAVVENVMQAVHQLCMVSPSDQDLYVLSAGTALGHVGAGLGLMDYLQNSLEAPRLGPTLVAATMHALILSDEAGAAWTLWKSRRGGEAAEWQWSGGSEQLPAVCTDLALRAAPAAEIDDEEVNPQYVLALYQSLVQAGKAVSVEAVVGLIRVLEQHGAWTEVVHVWLRVVAQAAQGRPTLVYGDELSCPDVLLLEEEQTQSSVNDDLVRELSHVLVPVLRACQTSEQYGLGLLCLSLWQGCLASESSLLSNQQNASLSWLSRLKSTIRQSSNGDDFLVATMTSLSGFDLPEAACKLFDTVVDEDNTENWMQAEDLRHFVGTQTSRFALMQRDRRLKTLGDEIPRFSLVLQSQGQADGNLEPDDARLLASALASTMESLISWKEPLMAQYLFRFIMDGGRSPAPTDLADVPDIISWPSYDLPITDSLASALITSYDALDNAEMALRVFDTITTGSNGVEIGHAWPLTATSVIKMLISMDAIDDAMQLFEEVANHSTNPNLYAVVASGLAAHQRWKDVSNVYRLALASRALSEEISLTAMMAIEMLKPPERVRLIRSIADEAAAMTGTAPLAWTEQHYHRLKTLISFSSLRRLLWWDDPKTAYLDELELVVGQWNSRKLAASTSSRALAPHIQSARIILQNAKHLHDRSIPPQKTRIPNVPRSPSAWKSLVDEIVNDLDLSIWRSKTGTKMVTDVIQAYRNLGSDHDCVAFTFNCLENEITVNPEGMEEAISAAEAIKDKNSAQALRVMMSDFNDEFA